MDYLCIWRLGRAFQCMYVHVDLLPSPHVHNSSRWKWGESFKLSAETCVHFQMQNVKSTVSIPDFKCICRLRGRNKVSTRVSTCPTVQEHPTSVLPQRPCSTQFWFSMRLFDALRSSSTISFTSESKSTLRFHPSNRSALAGLPSSRLFFSKFKVRTTRQKKREERRTRLPQA